MLDAQRSSYSAPTDRATGIIADQTIALDGYATSKDYPDHLRRIRFKDPESVLIRCGSPTVIAAGQLLLGSPPNSVSFSPPAKFAATADVPAPQSFLMQVDPGSGLISRSEPRSTCGPATNLGQAGHWRGPRAPIGGGTRVQVILARSPWSERYRPPPPFTRRSGGRGRQAADDIPRSRSALPVHVLSH
jgi:hypothetical protein